MPISAAMFRSERKNPVPQCPPRLDVQMLTPVIWSRMPNHFLAPEMGRISEKLGWMLQCQEPLTMMALHIPEENRSSLCIYLSLAFWPSQFWYLEPEVMIFGREVISYL